MGLQGKNTPGLRETARAWKHVFEERQGSRCGQQGSAYSRGRVRRAVSRGLCGSCRVLSCHHHPRTAAVGVLPAHLTLTLTELPPTPDPTVRDSQGQRGRGESRSPRFSMCAG